MLTGHDLVGHGLSLYFAGDATPTWKEGLVMRFCDDKKSKSCGEHLVSFNDGQKLWFDIDEECEAEQLRWSGGSRPTEPLSRRRQVSTPPAAPPAKPSVKPTAAPAKRVINFTSATQPQRESKPEPQQSGQPEQPEQAAPPPAAPAAAHRAVQPELSDYEKQRLANIERNNQVLAGLGLHHSLIPAKPAKPAVARAKRPREQQPSRQQPERGSRPQFELKDSMRILDEIECAPRAGVKKQRPNWRASADDSEDEGEEGRGRGSYSHVQVLAQEGEWLLPELPDGGTHRKSCHVCTQCVASWRGDFSKPLGCSSCALIWCSRCLTNIYPQFQQDATGLVVHDFIAQANAKAAFKCPMCLGVCACQLLKGGKGMERHKRAGWVGVTGNHDPTCSAPMHRELKKLQEEALLARAEAAAEDDEE